MTPYQTFKRIMIDAWPNGRVEAALHMALIDCKIAIPLLDGLYIKYQTFDEYMQKFNMPSARIPAHISTYLAAWYPKTSAALFDGASKDAAYAILLSEKKQKINANQRKSAGASNDAKKELMKAKAVKFIHLRELSKKHDWKTVK
jgi:hypothetical protein